MEEKIYFLPGDVVTLRQAIPYKPTMIVVKKENKIARPIKGVTLQEDRKREDSLKGIKCRWFTTEGLLQEAVFNTKDLIKIENGD
jgi:uncharacterized protein YodC (DUF2158 family)|nr:MAG TPA: putative small protein [Caudoviricetes sp.]